MPSPVADLLRDAAAAFDGVGVEWYLFGAQAALLHGAARLTADVDITVRLPRNVSAGILTDALERHGFELRRSDLAVIQDTPVIPLLHLPTSLPLDVVISGPGLEERFFDRAQLRDIEGVGTRVASAEDIVVMKILAARAKDLDDVAAIVLAHRKGLDADYVRDTLRLLEDALGQSDLLVVFERMWRSR